MSHVVRYLPLDGLGEVRLDLDECPRRFPRHLIDLTDDERENPPPMTWFLLAIYLTPDDRWVAHRFCTGPVIVNPPNNEVFHEVSLADAIQELGLSMTELPPDLLAVSPSRTEDTEGNKPLPPIDFDALENALLLQGKPTQAALVRFMAGRQTATAEEVANEVHGNSQTSNKAIGKNARETTDSLAGIGSRLSFRFTTSKMFRQIAAE
jgi:hypothetical protein